MVSYIKLSNIPWYSSDKEYVYEVFICTVEKHAKIYLEIEEINKIIIKMYFITVISL